MIALVCTQCQSGFQVDDGFAGGVCRCRVCGTIQTVPTREDIARGETGQGGRVMYRSEAAASDSSRELERLSEIVGGSGLGGSGLNGSGTGGSGTGGSGTGGSGTGGSGSGLGNSGFTGGGSGSGLYNKSQARSSTRVKSPESRSSVSNQPATPAASTTKRASHQWTQTSLVMIALGSLTLTGSIALVVWFAFAQTGHVTPDVNPESTLTKIVPRESPVIADINLSRSTSVGFLVDRGDATRNSLPDVKRAIIKSLETLGPTRRFQIVFWAVDEQVAAIPETPLPANSVNISQLQQPLEGVSEGRSTDILPALIKSLSYNPSDIVIITAKGWQLDDSFADQVLAARPANGPRVHVIVLGDDSIALRRIAETTGGDYRLYSSERFQQLAR